jgi:hypothetical protein
MWLINRLPAALCSSSFALAGKDDRMKHCNPTKSKECNCRPDDKHGKNQSCKNGGPLKYNHKTSTCECVFGKAVTE